MARRLIQKVPRTLAFAPPALVVAAHPDDEAIGAGIWIKRHRHLIVNVLHITDGSPHDMANAKTLGFELRSAYARARRAELMEAMALLDVTPERCHHFDLADKDAYLHFGELISRTRALILKLQPQVVLSPAYEGGHPDHDAAAYAVAMARQSGCPFQHLEFPLYHAGANGTMVTIRFLNDRQGQGEVLKLSAAEQFFKSRVLGCFHTQQDFLRHFDLSHERFRPAPQYDFTRPPHPGDLLYERWQWGISGCDWRRRASEAAENLSRPHPEV